MKWVVTHSSSSASRPRGPNYTAYRGNLVASKDGMKIAEMHPEKRIYLVQTMPMTEAAIDAGLTRDLFVALGEDLGNGRLSLRIYHKPFVRWLWLGGLLMAIGGGLAATDPTLSLTGAPRTQLDSSAAGPPHEPGDILPVLFLALAGLFWFVLGKMNGANTTRAMYRPQFIGRSAPSSPFRPAGSDADRCARPIWQAKSGC